MAQVSAQEQLADLMAECHYDPLKFVLVAYPWGEKGGPLENEVGPDENQREFLTALGLETRKRKFNGSDPVAPIRMNETSGHGTGKSVQGAWITNWIMSTRPMSQGTITAGTFSQLETRTWAAIQKWTKMCITKEWFDVMADGIYSKSHPEEWKAVIQTCKEENHQSFAGQHARTSTSWYLLDEASEVPDKIWQVAYGGLTDGEPMIFAWGQPVRNSGEFYNVCFGSLMHRWNTRRVDSRKSRFSNKELLDEWIEDYGEDSDYVRVRVFGLPPAASELQFIDNTRIKEAQKREVEVLRDDPLIVGFDVSGGGAAWNVMWFRRGNDARSIPPIKITGEAGRDRNVLITRAAAVMADRTLGRQVAAMFIDSAFGSPIVERLHTLGYKNVHEVNFGGTSPDLHQANMRAFMWNRMKDWLLKGAIPNTDKIAAELARPGYHQNRKSQLVLESKDDMKKRGEASPDEGDSLALTFARHVAPTKQDDSDGYEEEYEGWNGGGGSGKSLWG